MNPVRICIHLILIAIFGLLVVVIIKPLLAEVQFNAAEKLVTKYRWRDAEPKFEKAMRIDPFNSQYSAGYGEFILREASYLGYKVPHLKRAEKLYKRALELNPRCADYSLKLGQIQLMLFLEEKGKTAFVKNAFKDFRQALRNDPNGFNISYSIGYAGLSIWDFLDKKEKEFILERLKYSLKIKPWYYKYIYPKLWYAAGDSNLLRQITPESLRSNEYLLRLERIEAVKKAAATASSASNMVLKSDWRGTADNGKNVYEGGNMYWVGSVDAAILIPKGNAVIRIQAKGTPADKVYPHMIVELDGRKIGERFVDSPEWKEYDLRVKTSGGIQVLSITFANDAVSRISGEDRNLYIGEARVEQGI